MSNLLRATVMAVFFAPVTISAQGQPHLTVQLNIGLYTGTLDSRACLSRLPPDGVHEFILHRGLNIKSVRNGRGSLLRYDGYENGKFVGEGVVYRLADSLAVDDSVCIEYTGAFPVYEVDRGDFSTHDYKGFIAFNGRTVRAAEQTKWYPILYDSAQGSRAFQAVTYQATVRCVECEWIYLNGDEPRPGPVADFASDRPVQMLLFGGSFDVHQRSGLTLLNATSHEVSEQSFERLAMMVDTVRAFYQHWLGLEYGQPLVLLQHTMIEDNPERRWGFVTYPTIAFSNDGVGFFVDANTGETPTASWRFLGHEMAHYYFGTVVVPRGPYSWFLYESLPEYLGMQVLRRFGGDAAFDSRLSGYASNAAADSTSIPFDRVEAPDQIHGRYRYEYGPLIMFALEEHVGSDAIQHLLRSILRRPNFPWDYSALRATALAGGVSPHAWEAFEERCVRPAFARGCLPGLDSESDGSGSPHFE